MKTIYLDYAAATPLDEYVLDAMRPYFTEEFFNPSATYLAAKKIQNDLSGARSIVAATLGSRSSEIIFTAGGTEANNIAISGVARSFPSSHIVTTALEHDSVRGPIAFLTSQGWNSDEVDPQSDGIMVPKMIARAVRPDTVLVSVMYANNEIGTVQPIKQIAQELAAIRQARRIVGNGLPLYFHTDAAQAANYLDMHVHRLGVDLMTINGGKIYGPKQSGALFVGSHVELTPLLFGGGQERGLRSGTENVAASIGFATALRRAQELRHAESKRLHELQKQFFLRIMNTVPGAHSNGSLKQRLPNNVHITLPGTDNERMLFALDEAGIQCAAGSACSASKEETSHVLKSIGLSNEDARASLRFSMGRDTDELSIKKTVTAIAKLTP